MKRFAAFILCVVLAFTLISCGNAKEKIEENISNYIPRELNSYDVNTTLTDDEKLDLVHGFGEKKPVGAVVYLNGSLSKGDFFAVYEKDDPETLDAIMDIAFSGDVTYECKGAIDGLGYYSYAYYIRYFMEDGTEYTFYYNMYKHNNLLGYDGCWFYPDKPIDTYVFSVVYEAYDRYSEEGKVKNAFELRGEALFGGPTDIFTELQINSTVSYTDMTAEEKKAYLESFDTSKIESVFVFMHGSLSAGNHYELFQNEDEEMFNKVVDYAFNSGEFEIIPEISDGYAYEYYVTFKCTDGEEITLFFHDNGDYVRFDGQSFRVAGMFVEMFSDAPVYEGESYCNQNGKLKRGWQG